MTVISMSLFSSIIGFDNYWNNNLINKVNDYINFHKVEQLAANYEIKIRSTETFVNNFKEEDIDFYTCSMNDISEISIDGVLVSIIQRVLVSVI